MRITAVASTDLFAGTAARPVQIIRVTLAGDGPDPAGDIRIRVEGPGVTTPDPPVVSCPAAGDELTAEVGVEVAAPYAVGGPRQVMAIADRGDAGPRAELAATITVAETGWTMWMVSHFHYDPVWWSTQGQTTQSRLFLPDADGSLPDVRTAFELVRLHLEAARRDVDYKFVLAEIDYLKPHFDAHPQDRADLLEFIRAGRIEIVGGCYNEPNTNLTSAESTIRNAVYGLGYQREMLGGDPAVAWMLDAFGHDPGYPGLMAAAGLAESAWARGPFHQWGPNQTVGDNHRMQFASEFEWLSPDGSGLLTSYMANHYGAGWVTHQAASLAAAAQAAYRQFRELAPVAATRNVLLPVGADHVIPSRWVTGIHRDWNARYLWPRFVTALPSEFFAAVRKDAARRDVWITPQTRDMNPVYTGKDVSYIDTKQAQRAAEIAAEDGERLGTLAWLAGAPYPAQALDRAWRLLVFGGHHDAITGTESDQVYLDLLAGWREAYELGDTARRQAAAYLAALADTSGPAGGLPVVVFNTLSWARSGMVTVTLEAGPGAEQAELRDETGAGVPCLAEGGGRDDHALTLTFRARQVPALGYRTYWAYPAGPPAAGTPAAAPGAAAAAAAAAAVSAGGWQPAPGSVIENEVFAVSADPERGGALAGITDKRSGTQLLAGPGNELVLQEEYPQHPRWGEGPWLISTKGNRRGSGAGPARVRAERCPVGSRLVAEFALGGLRVRQETLLWDGADRVEFRTHVDGSIGQDRLLRVAFPARVPGGLPVYQTATAVIGRSPGSADTDVEQHDFTLDNPAHEWFGVGSTARVAVAGGRAGGGSTHAIGVAEVIAPAPGGQCREQIRDLVIALARAGVTATCSLPAGPRYGSIDLDSNLPDFRIALGGPEQNPVTAAVLAAAGPAAAAGLAAQLDAAGSARAWVPAGQSRAAAFAPGADLRGPADVPVLIVAGEDLAAAIGALSRDLADAVIEVPAPPPRPGPATPPGESPASYPSRGAGSAGDSPAGDNPADQGLADQGLADQGLAGHSVALLNRGTPGSLVTPDGVLYISLMRACSAWPCGVWIDGEKRTVPDGSSFAWQHWSHTFEYALATGPGDWRTAGFPLAGQDYNRDLLALATDQHGGPVPAAASLAEAAPATALLSALKPRGNPLAPGAQPRRADGVTVRLRDVSGSGRPVRARVRLRGGVSAAILTGLCEDGAGAPLRVRDHAAEAELPPSGLVTLALIPAAAPVPGRLVPETPPITQTPAVTQTPPVSPVFTRYWLHGKGPAPAGNLPETVHLSPARAALSAGQAAALRLTVACGTAPATGLVRLACPAGIAADPPGPLAYDLAPRGYDGWDLTVRALPGAAPGRYFVAAQIDGSRGILEDAVLITVGEPPPPPLDLPFDQLVPLYVADQEATAAELRVRLLSQELAAAPSGRADIEVALANATASQIRGEAQLLSPFGTWACTRSWTRGFSAEPGQEETLSFPVRVPATACPGQHWWALVKIMYFGRVRYSEPVAVTVVP